MYDVAALSKVGIALNTTSIGAAAASFSRGILANKFECSLTKTVEPVPEVRGTLGPVRVSSGISTFAPALSFPLDTGDADSGSIGDFLACVFGTDTGTLSGGKYKHKFTINDTDQPNWINLYSNKDAVAKQVVGFRPTSVKITIKGGDTLCMVEVSGIAYNESDLASAQTLTYCDAMPITPQQVSTFTIGGSAVTNFEQVIITITRGQEGLPLLGNSTVIGKLVSGKDFSFDIEATGLNFANETERAKFKSMTSSSFVLTLTDAVSNYITFNMSEMYYKSWTDPSISAGDLLKMSFAGFATGAHVGQYVELQNLFASRYDTGAAIS
jgi:hypothetical protein